MSTSRAKVDRRFPPTPCTGLPFRLPPFERHHLDNGFELLVLPLPRLPLIRADLLVPAGALHDPPERAGLATLTASLLDEGRKGATATELAEQLGGSLYTGATWNTAVANVTLMSDYLDEALSMLGRVVLEASFPPRELERMRSQRLANLGQQRFDPRQLAQRLLERVLYGSGSYGQPLHGSPATVARIRRGDLVDFHDRHYAMSGATLVAAGDLDAGTTAEMAAELFGGSKPLPVAAMPPEFGRRAALDRLEIHVLDLPAAPQVELRLGYPSVPYHHPDTPLLELLSRILGGGITGRLDRNLRERHGYTYGVKSELVARLGPGPFLISTAVATSSVAAALREILHELDRIREEPVTPEELSDCQGSLGGEVVARFQTVEGVVNMLSSLAVFGLPPDHFERSLGQIGAATPEGLLRVARQHIKSRYIAVVCTGPAASVVPQLETLGPVEVWSLANAPI